MRIIDISQKLHDGMLVYPGDPEFVSKGVCSFNNGDDCEVSRLTIGSHCGTHIDAPAHMVLFGKTIEQIPLESYYGLCRVLTVAQERIGKKMLEDMQIQAGERILLKTDPDAVYLHKKDMNPAGITPDAAEYLVSCGIRLIGIDAPSIEDIQRDSGEVHRCLLGADIPIVEGLDLHAVPDGTYTLSAFPLALQGENGSPCRAVLICE